MARRHGCQLPAHNLQVLATSVFFMLSFAFYAFFAPFLGKQIYEHVAVALYSIFIVSVIILYIRCAVIDPADSRILNAGGVSAYKSQSGVDYGEPSQIGLNPELKTSEKKLMTCSEIICCLYGLMVKEDCRNNVGTTQRQLNYDEVLYCSLCNAETICTALALIAMVPLGELFFFHMILIKKGITTYDFIVAMRTQSEPPVHAQHHSLPSSSASSTPSTMNKPEEIMVQLEGNCVPSNIDPDAPGPTESAKSTSKLPTIRISAWKLLKLNSNEAMKAGAMARAPSSFLRPICSHTNSLNSHGGTPTLLPFKGSYHLPSSTLSNPLVMKVQQNSSTKHFNNPIYRSSTRLAPCSTRASDGEESTSEVPTEHKVVKSGDPSMESTSSSVYWDEEVGCFVSSQNVVVPSSSRSGSHAELVYSGSSILFGGPFSNERTLNSSNGRGSSQLPVFVPSELNQQNK